MEPKIVILTGGSSGIGRETGLELLRRGCTVYELSRHPGDAPGLIHIDCDVSQEAQVRAAVGEVAAREGRIDILVNNAGCGISGAAEFTRNEDAKRMLDVLLFGTANLCSAVIPFMREQSDGRIVNLSSVAAVVPIPFQSWYSAGKAAVNLYSGALACEVRPFGITVCTVMPGDAATGFTDARVKNDAGAEFYGDRIRAGVARMEQDERSGMSPAKVGRFVAAVALKKRVKPEYAVDWRYATAAVLMRLLPRRFSTWLIRLLYAS